jgi:hypothetical protein
VKRLEQARNNIPALEARQPSDFLGNSSALVLIKLSRRFTSGYFPIAARAAFRKFSTGFI